MRILAFGDSFVAGAGDPDHLGWIGRALRGRREVSLYNLGVRRETSEEIAARWKAEALPRLVEHEPVRLVFAFGCNDCTLPAGAAAVRVSPAASLKAAQAIFAEAASIAPALWVGPPPVSDPAARERARALNLQFQTLAARMRVPFLDVFDRLCADPVWLGEVAAWDGAHPGASGYQALADLVAGHAAWIRFIEG